MATSPANILYHSTLYSKSAPAMSQTNRAKDDGTKDDRPGSLRRSMPILPMIVSMS